MKKLLLELAQKDLKKFFPVDALKSRGFYRKRCKICGRNFWTLDDKREVCGDHEPYGFFDKDLSKKKLSYKDVWIDFSKFLEKRGYRPIRRYPVVARWRDDLDFVIASIADFQPWVVKGIAKPPAKKLTVPQFCLRFTDIDNVGLTSRHYTGFVMIGQHAFVPPNEYDINSYFNDLFDWFLSLGIPEEEFVLHEDGWAGGGNAGTSIEFFVRGLELANQVYMQFETINNEIRELRNIKVLDMGMGQERVAWFLNKTPTSYDAVFPNVIEYLKKVVKEELDFEFLKKFIPFSYSLNVEDVDIDLEFKKLASKLNYNLEDFKKKLNPFIALYAIAEHTRSLLIAISDGALPSNVGGGYNLRVIFRRAYDFFERYFEGDFIKIFEIHLKDLKGFYDDVSENLDIVEEVIKYEIEKYKESKRRLRSIIRRYSGRELGEEELFELYISHGVRPEDLGIKPPQGFYKKLIEFREKSKKVEKKEEIILEREYPPTKLLYYDDWKKKINVSNVIDVEGNCVIFDSTIFYPTGGGQKNDTGWLIKYDNFINILVEYKDKVDLETLRQILIGIYGKSGEELLRMSDIKFKSRVGVEKEIKGIFNLRKKLEEISIKVVDVIKVGNVVVHKVDRKIEPGKYIQILNWERRLKLTKYHDAVHILNGVLRKYYGKIIWQAGAEKDENRARLDVTYYRLPTENEIKEIEEMVNRVIWEDRKIIKKWMERNEAEEKYGFVIYQGGAVPGRELRIVEIEDIDVEACGGTHGDSTGHIGFVKIRKVEKIADGVIRFEIYVGEDALRYIQDIEDLLKKSAEVARVSIEYVPNTIEKFFRQWKEASKKFEATLDIIAEFLKEKKELRAPDALNLEDMVKIIRKVGEGRYMIFNNKFMVCKGYEEDEIVKRGYEIIRRGEILIGKKI